MATFVEMKSLADSLASAGRAMPQVALALMRDFRLRTVYDALWFLPLRYEDRSQFLMVHQLNGQMASAQVAGQLVSIQIVQGGGRARLEGLLRDAQGQELRLVWFQSVKWIYRRLRVGGDYVAYGKVSEYKGSYSLTQPRMDYRAPSAPLEGHIEPVYSSTQQMRQEKVGSASVASFMEGLLSDYAPLLEEYLPLEIQSAYALPPRGWAFQHIHSPRRMEEVLAARYRLKFDELFVLQADMLSQAEGRRHEHQGIVFSRVGECFNRLYKEQLPFDLTGAQKRVLRAMRADMGSGRQMNRLLQGDVGSGKTLVALFCMLLAVDNGYQACLMAPTEILAEQHMATLRHYLDGLPVRIGLLTGSTPLRVRRELLVGVETGAVQLLVGTHALLEDAVRFHELGLVVVDEQHRFGVEQRAKLWVKNGSVYPHVLIMTATPIPRTLALTVYGDLEVSVIDELPPGRRPVQTLLTYEDRRGEVYRLMQGQLACGRQVYVVYPLIEESEELDLRSLEEGFAQIKDYFSGQGYRVGMLHGRMRAEEKQAAMLAFSSKRTQILVATTVIEVGVDVPNATVMVIESAQRFGLSQLHQLRGRVGRGGAQSYCVLVASRKMKPATRARLSAMVATNDGFRIAEADLRLRGSGQLEGVAQSGHDLGLRVASVLEDAELLVAVRQTVKELLAADPLLERPAHAKLKAAIAFRRATRDPLIQVG